MADPSALPEQRLVAVIAEDEPLLRLLAVQSLDDAGFTTFAADNAVAALNICKARQGEVDVLFTDIRMPGSMDGLELAHRVRERWPGVVILIASGNIFVGRDQLPEGARFLPKPYDLDQVVDLIRQMRCGR